MFPNWQSFENWPIHLERYSGRRIVRILLASFHFLFLSFSFQILKSSLFESIYIYDSWHKVTGNGVSVILAPTRHQTIRLLQEAGHQVPRTKQKSQRPRGSPRPQLMEEPGDHQLRLVVYPIIYRRGFYISQVRHRISSTKLKACKTERTMSESVCNSEQPLDWNQWIGHHKTRGIQYIASDCNGSLCPSCKHWVRSLPTLTLVGAPPRRETKYEASPQTKHHLHAIVQLLQNSRPLGTASNHPTSLWPKYTDSVSLLSIICASGRSCKWLCLYSGIWTQPCITLR